MCATACVCSFGNASFAEVCVILCESNILVGIVVARSLLWCKDRVPMKFASSYQFFSRLLKNAIVETWPKQWNVSNQSSV